MGDVNEMDTGNATSYLDDDEDNAPPLMEELGINFEHILLKTQAVLYPNRTLEAKVVEDCDMAGPLVFCLILGAMMLLGGKVNFGYIYGFSFFSCIGIYGILNLICSSSLDVWFICSVLGYGLVPVVLLAAASLGVNGTSIVTGVSMKGLFGFFLSAVAVAWATFSATRLFDAKLRLNDNEQFWLCAYPTALVYWCFTLITVL
jgi:protein YIPF5/7